MNIDIDNEKHFQLPIYYNSQKKQVNPTIIHDLELIETVDSSNNPIYSHFFHLNEKRKNDFTDEVMKQASEYYTIDIENILIHLKSHKFIFNNTKVIKKLHYLSEVDYFDLLINYDIKYRMSGAEEE